MFTLNFLVAILIVIVIAGIAFLIARKIINSDMFETELMGNPEDIGVPICDGSCPNIVDKLTLHKFAYLNDVKVEIIDIDLNENIAKYKDSEGNLIMESIDKFEWVKVSKLEEAGGNIVME